MFRTNKASMQYKIRQLEEALDKEALLVTQYRNLYINAANRSEDIVSISQNEAKDLMKFVHPDKHNGNKRAEELFKILSSSSNG